MSHISTIKIALAVAIALAVNSQAHAAVLTFDSAPGTAGVQAGTNVWDVGVTNDWQDASLANVVWTQGSDASIGAGSTLTITSPDNIQAASITQTGNGVVTIGGTGTLTLGNGVSGQATALSTSGGSSINLNVASVVLANNQTWNNTGNNGVSVGAATNITGSGIVLTLGGNGKPYTFAAGGSVNIGALTLTQSGVSTSTFNNNVTLTGALTQTVGTSTFTGANSFGSVALSGASVSTFTTTAALPNYATPAGITVGNTATLGVRVGGTGFTAVELNTLKTNATIATTAFLGVDTTNGDFSLDSFTANHGLHKLGTNNLTLTGTGAYNATAISGGTLKVGSATAFGSASAMTVNTGAVLDVNGFSVGVGDVNGAGTIRNGLDGTNAVLTIGNGVGAGTFSGVVANNGGGAATGTVAVVKNGTGSITLSGASTYTGGTTVNAGTLISGQANALGAGGTNILVTGGTLSLRGNAANNSAVETIGYNKNINITGNSTLEVARLSQGGQKTIANSGTLSVGAQTVIVTNAQGFAYQQIGATTVSGNATFQNNMNSFTGGGSQASNPNGFTLNTVTVADSVTTGTATNVTFLVNPTGVTNGFANTGNTFITGAISNNATDLTKTLGITKTGTGVLTLSGANTYSGSTTVSAGTLVTTGTGTLGTGNVSVAGATLTLQSTVSFSDAAILNFGSTSVINLNFTGSDALAGITDTTTSQSLLTPGSYTATELNNIFTVSSFTGTGVLTVVPEPSTWAIMLGSLGMVALMRRRRLS